MDRPIDRRFRRKQIVKRGIQAMMAVALIAFTLIWAPGWIAPSVSRNRIRTATVDAGPIEATITASGTVIPEFEQVLSSPIDTRVVNILSRPGAILKKGQPILDLDVSESLLTFENKLDDLNSQLQIKNLDLQFYDATYAKNRKMYERGLIPEDQVNQAKLAVDKADIELQRLENSIRNTRQSIQTQLDGWVPESQMLQDRSAENPRRITLATLRADRDGVLTYVTPQEGIAVHKGEIIARIADLSSFHVEAAVSDVHATRLHTGLPVRVKVNDDYLTGTITHILPTIEDGIITLQVGLEDRSSKLLRSNLRVDVFIITERRARALRVKKGPALNGEGSQDVFVIRGDMAIKTPVRIGLSSFDHSEILDGLLEGDEVILSDMSDYTHMKEVKVK
ncbi:MAG: HlyD family efflux transporter periplasmic adaptor subunit [Candidatus Latescibacteria bacterium]|nr:HlyD family efflux transporter periplasmic adaptor subunit [Candidatus Latescibacterota bacterium]